MRDLRTGGDARGLAKTCGPYWLEQAKLYVRMYSELHTVKGRTNDGIWCIEDPPEHMHIVYAFDYDEVTTFN